MVLLFACLICAAPAARAQAVVLASTLGNSDNGWLQLDFNNHWYSQPFQTTGTLYSITSVTLNMASVAGSNVTLRVYTNSSGHPGSDTGVIFTTPANSDSRVNTTFNFSSGPTLATNTPYWLVIYNTVDYKTIKLTYSTATTGTGSGFVASAPLFNPSTGNINGWYDQNPGKYLHYSISAIPEPSTYAAIFGVSALALAVYRRRKRRVPVT